MKRLVLVFSVLALTVPALALASCGSDDDDAGSDPPAKTTASKGGGDELPVALSEWAVKPGSSTVAAGAVTMKATNDGQVEHELVVLQTDKPADKLAKPGTADVPEEGEQGEIEDIAAGATGSRTFDLHPGHYVLLCNLPTHWAQGMRADLTVQ